MKEPLLGIQVQMVVHLSENGKAWGRFENAEKCL